MLKFSKRFFEPVFLNPKINLLSLVEATVSAIGFDLIPLFSIPLVITLVTEKRQEEIVLLSLALLFLYSILWTINTFIRKWDLAARHLYNIDLENKYRINFILKDNLAFEKFGTGKVQSIFNRGMYAWTDAVWQIVYQIPKTIIAIISGIYFSYLLGKGYMLFFGAMVFLSSLGYVYFRNKRLKYEVEINDLEDVKNSDSTRIFMSRSEIIFSGREKTELKRINKNNLQQYKSDSVSAKYEFLSDLSISGFVYSLPFCTLLIMIKTGAFVGVETAVLISFIYFTGRLSNFLYSALWIVRQVYDKYPQIKKFWDFVDEVPQIKNYESGAEFVHTGGEIVLEDVSFKYGDESKENILENFSFKIKAGEKIALVGKSGSGKTTLAKLISGYMATTSGKVLVDGQNMSDLSLKSYYKYLGYLTQEPMVFDGTIKENLLYAVQWKGTEKGDFTKEIKNALQKANCDFVFKMGKGVETQIGEKGVRLSGGERQRLAIAKLFLKNPEIIILDEPTSALDSFSEEKISEALEELFKGRTTIIIAHRLQTVKKADRILVLEGGKIVEEGSHEVLVSKGGVYAQMLAMQSGF